MIPSADIVRLHSSRTYNVLDDQELREGIKDYSSWPTIPQIYLKGDFLGGFDILLSSECRQLEFVLCYT